MKYCPTMKKNKLELPTRIWMNFTDIWRERSWAERSEHCY